MKPMFPPEKCPKCGADTVVMHYVNGYRVECPNNPKCDWYGVFHFDEIPEIKHDDPYEVHKQIKGSPCPYGGTT